jgi:hypothetical protein
MPDEDLRPVLTRHLSMSMAAKRRNHTERSDIESCRM